jgi:phenylpropionate dioxygenase-like ring-hydroxylating dioxygenase large terminal subunit
MPAAGAEDNAMTLDERIEQRINEGLPGAWYVVAKSADLQPGAPVAVKRLGRNLVLWRDADGKACCIEDYCPHRGAPLSRGLVIDGQLSCRYHGVTLDATGTIVRVPAMPECPLEGRKALDAYTTMEVADAIFAWFPSADQIEPQPYDVPFELTDGAYAHFLCTATWECNYRYALENLADPMHGIYLHVDSFTLAYGSKQDVMKLERSDDGFTVARAGQQGENFDWAEAHVDCALPYFRIDIPYPPAAGPGGPMRIIALLTPVDETNCQIFFWRCRKVSGLEREVWRFMYRAVFEPRHWHVLEQDRDMLRALPDDARKREMLYQHDVGVGAIRRILGRRAREQVEAEMRNEMRIAN